MLLVERGLAPTRERAQALILAGRVRVDGRSGDKAGARVPVGSVIEVEGPACPYVSRGGLKLERALDVFGIAPEGCVCLDAGASTGGFTDCLLQRGARRVYAIDVGYGQLDARLRADARVVSSERVNARHLSRDQVPEPIDVAVADVSFISLSKIVPAITPLLTASAHLVALVKPQFEAGPRDVGKGGVVRDPAVHRRVLHEVAAACRNSGLAPQGVVPSPILGPAGNAEFLLWCRPVGACAGSAVDLDVCIESALLEASSMR